MTSALKKPWGPKKVPPPVQVAPTSVEDAGKLLDYIDQNVIGKETSFSGPFGRRKVVYCDYNGCGRALQFLEDHVASDILPTHTTQCTATSHTSLQSCLYRSEARAYIHSSVGGDEEDVVILGASPARLLRALRLPAPAVFVCARVPAKLLAPWRECDAEIIAIPETKEGFIDLTILEQRLQERSGCGSRMIGFFPAASKLTGLLADDVATTCLLHQYGAWAFWDYSLVAPSSAVEMNHTISSPNLLEEQSVKKDAVFFNCEKLVGGVQAPFVAVVKRHVFVNSPIYTEDLVALADRVEEVGAAEAARATLVLQLRDAVGLQTIAQRQDRITRQVLQHIGNIRELILLGAESPTGRRLPIFSLLVKHPRGTFLHHNFVCAVLNDVFGIQVRGGLRGDMSYGHDVLGIDAQMLREYEKLLNDDLSKMVNVATPTDIKPNEHLRPGFIRVSLPYFMSDDELGFVLEALKMVATEGWKILPQYVVNPQNGQWSHHTNAVFRGRKSLFNVRYNDCKMTTHERRISVVGIFPQNYKECLQTARNLFSRARKQAMKCSIADQDISFNPRTDYLRWFMLPREAHDLLLGRSGNVKHIVPFDPSGYTGARKSLLTRIPYSAMLANTQRHYSLSAIDDCALIRLKNKTKFFSRETSLLEKENQSSSPHKSPPVQFAVDGSISPIYKSKKEPTSPIRSRCYSLGYEAQTPAISPQTRSNLGLTSTDKNSSFCHCGSQTDLQSLDDPMASPTRGFPYVTPTASISDCSQAGRISPTVSITSHTSEDLQAYVKDMTKEIAAEIKSEIREVISQVDDILENSDAVDANASAASSQCDSNSVSVIDVAQYLMGVSKEMASEVKHEIREMVNQVDEMISPDMLSFCSNLRRSSPPQSMRKRVGSGPELGLELTDNSQTPLKKCPTSPILSYQEDEIVFRTSPHRSMQGTPLREASCTKNVSFTSSETSTPETIIQMLSSSLDSPALPKSLSSHKLLDDECTHMCRHNCSRKKNWCQDPSVSSQDSGINMSFPETDSYQDFVKWRSCSDPANKGKRSQGRLKFCQRYEKNEVPDIIEGVPVYSSDYAACCGAEGRHGGAAGDETVSRETGSERRPRLTEQRAHRDGQSACEEPRKVSAFYQRDSSSSSEAEDGDDGAERAAGGRSDSSADTDSSVEFTLDDDSNWQPPGKAVWKPTVEAMHEYGMVRPQDKVLACVSGGRDSLALLHTLHHYQFYARSKGVHFSIGAVFVRGAKCDVDPLHLMAYCRTLGVKFICHDNAEEDEKSESPNARETHRWATHGVRRSVYAAAAQHGYTTLALAQHLDHSARAFLASAFHGGVLQTTRACYYIREHNLRVIRPFIYVREADLADFSLKSDIPDFRTQIRQPGDETRAVSELAQPASKEAPVRDRSASAPCASAAAGAPARTRTRSEPSAAARDMLAYNEQLYPCLFTSLRAALHPLISAKNLDKDLKERRHRKKSVIQMKNGAPVYDSEEGTDEEPVP